LDISSIAPLYQVAFICISLIIVMAFQPVPNVVKTYHQNLVFVFAGDIERLSSNKTKF